MENSLISWTHHTANLWIGCQKVHAGCDFCYAETLDNRWKGNHWGTHTRRKIVNSVWENFKRFQTLAQKSGGVHRVFVGSMMDIFEKPVAVEDSKGNILPRLLTSDLRDRFFQDIVPTCPNLQFLLLTKRPSNIKKYIPTDWMRKPPENVMYGYSVVDEDTSDGIDDLISIPGKHFLSMEPLLGDVNLSKWINTGLIDWVIVGGESGNKKEIRPMRLEWARSIRDQVLSAGIPFHFKQWGMHEPDIYGQMKRVTTKDHAAKLDGVEHKQFAKTI